MKEINKFKNEEAGIEASAYYMEDGRIGVRLFDTDAEETVSVRIFPASMLIHAVGYAQSLI